MSTDESKDLELLDRVLTKFAHAQSDEALGKALASFLVPTLKLLARPGAGKILCCIALDTPIFEKIDKINTKDAVLCVVEVSRREPISKFGLIRQPI